MTTTALVGMGGVSLTLARWADTAAAVAICFMLSALAIWFALQVRRLIAGVPVAESDQRALIAAIGLAANKTGAIRQVTAVDAICVGPGAVLITVQAEFKEGVAAQHLAPVLAALRAAAVAAVPEVAELVLAPASANAKPSF